MKCRALFFLFLFAARVWCASSPNDSVTNELRIKAEGGDARAECNLGLAYLVGDGVPKDETEAMRWFLKASDQRNPRAQLYMGLIYTEGLGVNKDPVEALKWYRSAANLGDPEAEYNLGFRYARGDGLAKDMAEATKWFRKSAEQGYAFAQSSLSDVYHSGDGAPKDAVEAEKWCRKAAEQGLASAQYNLGQMCVHGVGVTKNLVEGEAWIRKAAEQGNASAQYYVGGMYGLGNGVAKDMAQAVEWFRKAAAQGNVGAESALGDIYCSGEDVPEDLAESTKWYRKGAEHGDAHSQSALGQRLYSGLSIPKDVVEAVKWIRMAAEQGYAAAQSNLGLFYDNGEGVPKDVVEAVKWYLRAAEQGSPSAQYNLGVSYYKGTGVAKDEVESLAWFNIGAATGNMKAVQARNNIELIVGREKTLVAQQRSKQILTKIQSGGPGASIDMDKDSTRPQMPKEGLPKSTGTGAIVSRNGYVLTAAHVVAGAVRLNILTVGGMKTAKVVRIDEANDLAILQLTGGDFAALPIAPSRKIRLGQGVSTIGFPNVTIQGFSPKVTRGEISSLNGIGDDPRGWQISVPVQPGNSGGPLLDESGSLIGIVLSKLGLKAAAATGDLPQNVSYAVKSAYALPLLEPYLDANAPEPAAPVQKQSFEDIVAKAQQSVVLILAY